LNKKYNIIFMDTIMPKMDGFRATEYIRKFESQNNFEPTFIVGVGKTLDGCEEEKGRMAGMNEFLSRPIDIEKFREIIANK
jgi:CheY-like chemotaxis protein